MKRSTLIVNESMFFYRTVYDVRRQRCSAGHRQAFCDERGSAELGRHVIYPCNGCVSWSLSEKLPTCGAARKVLKTGIVLFALSPLCCQSVSVSGTMLICLRIIQGLGGAMINATTLAIVSSVFPPNERGRAIGINVAVVYIGFSAGPFFGGVLTQHLGWQGVFLAPVVVALMALIAGADKTQGRVGGRQRRDSSICWEASITVFH